MKSETFGNWLNFQNHLFSVSFSIECRKRGAFLKLIKPNVSMANWLSEEPRSLLRAMSMTVCDLSAITKPWPIEKRVADLVTSEFFEQGDMERQELNITPIVSVHVFFFSFRFHVHNLCECALCVLVRVFTQACLLVWSVYLFGQHYRA